jgi:hypothetical protein
MSKAKSGVIRLLRPLKITVVMDTNGWFVASNKRFNEWGTGESASRACADLMQAIGSHYDLVADSAEDGDRYDQAELRYMRKYIKVPRG